jgi:hypothetical protein
MMAGQSVTGQGSEIGRWSAAEFADSELGCSWSVRRQPGLVCGDADADPLLALTGRLKQKKLGWSKETICRLPVVVF